MVKSRDGRKRRRKGTIMSKKGKKATWRVQKPGEAFKINKIFKIL
jgi:hypothetical protein